jgi:GNAT superfamily N-acetyltransferase
MKPRIQISLHIDCAGFHHAQADMVLRASTMDGKEVGHVSIAVFSGMLYLQAIEVLAAYRRLGIGLAMMNFLAQLYGPDRLCWGTLTKDGAALYRAFLAQFPLNHRINLRAGIRNIGRKRRAVDPAIREILANAPKAATTWSKAA